jgi:NAD(P)H-hydrate epimerase
LTVPIRRIAEWPPIVTAQEMRWMDDRAVRQYQLPLLVMMEHAGRALADLLLRRFRPRAEATILVLAGKGGNAGGALAAGRLLLHKGYRVRAVTTEAATKFRDESLRQLAMFRKEGGSASSLATQPSLPEADFLLDGVLGYGLLDAPKGNAAELIRLANEHPAPAVALDLPSGLHPDRGTPVDPTLEAEATLTLALPKEGLTKRSGRRYVGELYLGDIGFPRRLYQDLDTTPEAIFGGDWLVGLPSP